MIDEKKLIEETQKYFVNNSIHKNDLAEVIANLPKAGEWIPRSERLPEDTKTKAITFADGSVDGGYYSEENWWCVGDSISLEVVNTENVIAWMPLPEPYEERNEE